MLLPRTHRSIFHLGEEGGGAGHEGSSVGGGVAHHHQRLGGRRRDVAADAVVGLQILVRQHGHHRHPQPCHIVLKQMVPAAAARRRSFLGACSLCRRELSPSKDVYMYRGDQGFCSEECRWQQIMEDEAREKEAMARRKERRGLHHHHHHRGPRSSAAVGCSPRRPLAVS